MTPKQFKNSQINHIKPNHTEITIAGYTAFYSYESLIVLKDPDSQIWLGEDWRISASTSKHRSRYLEESTKDTQQKLDSGEYKLL